jgi:uncharacterized protein DUF2799
MKTTTIVSLFALVLAAFLAACATTPDDLAECQGADWYRIGNRDGQAGRDSQLQARSAACASLGVKPDAAQYDKGLQDGRANHAATTARRNISLF